MADRSTDSAMALRSSAAGGGLRPTVVLLFEPGRIRVDTDLSRNSLTGLKRTCAWASPPAPARVRDGCLFRAGNFR